MSQDYIEKRIAALVHGRYLVRRGAEADEGCGLLVGFHGYAKNSGRHLDHLLGIPGVSRWVVCAVDALYPFYNRTGEVVGSWMTRRNRELAIDDNVRYVASVVSEVRRETGDSGALVIAGFSQGVAMAYRAALRCGFPCHGLMVLAGDVPPEIAAGDTPHFPPVLLGRGTWDKVYNEARMNEDLEVLARKQAAVETCVFEGGHEWTEDYFQAAGRFLERVRGDK